MYVCKVLSQFSSCHEAVVFFVREGRAAIFLAAAVVFLVVFAVLRIVFGFATAVFPAVRRVVFGLADTTC